jgi:hypothetical protein
MDLEAEELRERYNSLSFTNGVKKHITAPRYTRRE